MNFDYLNYIKKKKEVVSIALLGASALLAVLVLIKLAGFFVASARAKGIVEKAVSQNNAGTKDIDKHLAEFKAVAEQLKKNNLLAPPPPKEHPVKQVEGIMGDEVFINGNWHKVGDRIADARIIAIGPASVRIEWDGNEKEFYPIMSGSSEGPERPMPGRETARAEGGRPERAEMVVVRSEAGPAPGREGAFGGRMRGPMGDMSEAERERFRTEMRAMRERFMNATPEEREKLRDEMRARFGDRFGPRSGRGGGGQ